MNSITSKNNTVPIIGAGKGMGLAAKKGLPVHDGNKVINGIEE